MKHITRNKKCPRDLFHVPCFGFHERGFTLFEVIIVVLILLTLAAIAIPSIRSLQKTPQLTTTAQEVINILRVAQNKTLSSEGNSQYGVYFKTTTTPHQYLVFKGSSYVARDTAFDQTYSLPAAVEFYEVATGGNNEVVFDRLTGTTANAGNVSLRLKNDTGQTSIVYIDNSGVVGASALLAAPDTNRVKDSRHVDFDYSRVIDTATENLILMFNGSTVQTIPINQYTSTGQIDFEGTFNVAGSSQTVRVHTIHLNSPDTRFSIFRDMRQNNKSLTVKLSADNTGTLAEYSADGLATDHHSIYVSNFAWQ